MRDLKKRLNQHSEELYKYEFKDRITRFNIYIIYSSIVHFFTFLGKKIRTKYTKIIL